MYITLDRAVKHNMHNMTGKVKVKVKLLEDQPVKDIE